MNAEQRQLAADLWIKPTDLSHKPACRQQRRTQDFRMGGVEVPQAPRGMRRVGGGIPLPTGGRVWGGDVPPPQNFFVFFVENSLF